MFPPLSPAPLVPAEPPAREANAAYDQQGIEVLSSTKVHHRPRPDRWPWGCFILSAHRTAQHLALGQAGHPSITAPQLPSAAALLPSLWFAAPPGTPVVTIWSRPAHSTG